MKWLKDNPLGVTFAVVSGVFVLLALSMVIIWNLPVTVETSGVETPDNADGDISVVAHQVASVGDFQIINERPVFNESRLPVIALSDDDELLEDTTIAIKDAPNVRLTGVIITPALKIASLTLVDAGQENVMAHEGQPLTGEFVGWAVSTVSPRAVVLESRDGQKLELDLQVHDITITEPPKPAAPAKNAQAEPDQQGEVVGEDGQPLSRAEQIRQRIAERREELRLEQQEQQTQSAAQSGGTNQAAKPKDYQSAIRAMIKNNRKDQSSNDKEDE